MTRVLYLLVEISFFKRLWIRAGSRQFDLTRQTDRASSITFSNEFTLVIKASENFVFKRVRLAKVRERGNELGKPQMDLTEP